MLLAEPLTFVVGAYIVKQTPEPDRQWPLYRVYLGGVLIGKSFSMPDEDACRWLEHQQRAQTFYAYSSAKLPELSMNKSGVRRSVGDARRAAQARAARTRRI